MNVEIYDIETYKEAFIVCCKNRDTLEKTHFEISFRKNDTIPLLEHLRQTNGQIGFNNLNFDYPIIHWFVNNYQNYKETELPEIICNKAQDIIKQEFSSINPKEVIIPQLDLFRIWHYSNVARTCSLKYLEFTMKMDNIEDLPYGIYDHLTSEMIDKIISYCHHDVEATYQFYLKSLGRINLRKNFNTKYGLNLINRPDVGIAEDLMLDSYCKQTQLDKYYVKQLQSTYDWIQGNDVILPIVRFQTEELNIWLDKLKATYLKRKGGFWKGETIKLFDEEYQIGLGGIHIIQKPGIYTKLDNEYLAELDCAGMYPTFIAKHGLYPKHLGVEFLTLYRQIRDDRMLAKKTGDKVMDAAGKLIGNGLFGKFGSDTSWLFDLKMLYTTTVNNQLFLLMLIEQCGLNDIKIISANTDSITVHITDDKLELLQEIKTNWENITLHTLEETKYNKLIMRDVNNYLAQTSELKLKYKGAFDTYEDFESEKFDGWHKNQSEVIVSIALRDFFIYNIPIEQTIKNHTNIFDFCKAVKGIKQSEFEERWYEKGILQVNKLQKRVNRYIVSNSNHKLIKTLPSLKTEEGNLKNDKLAKYRKETPQQLDIFHFVDDVIVDKDREFDVEANYNITIMNIINSKNIQDYNINYDYYINECYKIIKQIN